MTKIMNKGKVDVKKIGKHKTLITPADEEIDDGTTIANSGHRSKYSDYSLGKEYDPSGEPDLMSKDEKKVGDYFDNLGEEEAPDDIDPIFGKAEEESSISISGPPADSTIPANSLYVDDEEEEDIPAGEASPDELFQCPECNTTMMVSNKNMYDHLINDHKKEDAYGHMEGQLWQSESIESILNEAEFREEDHPRDGGKFTTKGGGDTGGDKDMTGFIKNKIKSGTPSSNMQDHLRKEYPNTSEDQMRVAINKSYDEIQGTTSNVDNYRKNKGGSTDKPKKDNIPKAEPKKEKKTKKMLHSRTGNWSIEVPLEPKHRSNLIKRAKSGYNVLESDKDKEKVKKKIDNIDNLSDEDVSKLDMWIGGREKDIPTGEPPFKWNESYAEERDFYTSNKQIDNQAWEIMAEEEFGKSVSELNDAQYDWIDQIMHDYGNDLDRSKKPSNEGIEEENLDDAEMWIGAYDTMGMSVEDINNKLKGMAIPNDTIKKAWDNYKLNPTKNRNFESRANEGGVGSGRKPEGGGSAWLSVTPKNLNDTHGYGVWGDADTSTLKQWMNDQKDNPEQADNYKEVKKELDRRGEAIEAKLKAGYIQCPHCDQQFSNIQWLSDHINELHEGKESKASESVTSWWGGKSQSSLEFRSKVLSRAGVYEGFQDKEFWELPEYVQDKVFELYSGGYVGESYAREARYEVTIQGMDGGYFKTTVDAPDEDYAVYQARNQALTEKGEGYYDDTISFVKGVIRVGEAKAKEDWYDMPNTDYKPEVLRWGMVNADTEQDWGFQTDNKAEAQRAVDEWNSSDRGYKVKIVDNHGYESYAKEFQPERQGKRVKLLTGDYAGKTGTIATVEIIGDGFTVRVDGVHNEYETGVNASPSEVEFLGGEAEPAGYYGFGSATGRMPPPEDWKQGGDMYKPSSSMFSDFRNSGLTWNELPTDIQDAWKSERDYMVNEELEGEATPESDVEELSKLNQLYKNEEEEQAQGEDETEDLELVSDLMDMELEEIGTEEFREDEHPRDHGKFTTKGGGDSERNKVLDDPSSSKQEREDAEKGLGKKEDIPTAEPKKEPKKEEPKYSHTKPNNPKRFNLIKSRVLKALGEPKDDWGKRYTDRVEKLEGFPTSGYQLEDLSVKYKAPILKAHLMDQHPSTKWSVKSEHFSGGSAIDAGYKGGEYPYGASEIGDVYSQRGAGYDSQTDYFPIDNYTHVYDQRENQPRGDPQTIAKDRPDRLWSWVNLKFDEENEYDMGRQWSRHIAEDIIKGKGDTGGGYQGVSDEMMGKIKKVYNDFVEQERKEKTGESFKKKLSEFEDSDRPVSPNSLMRYTEPIDLPTGKNAMDQTYGTSEPETPDGQDLTGKTIGEDIKEKKPFKPIYYYYKQYPFGRRAGKQNPFGEAKEVSLRVMNRAHQWWDSKYPSRQWKDMGIGERQNAILAFLRDPDTTILGESYANEYLDLSSWSEDKLKSYLQDDLDALSSTGEWRINEGIDELKEELERRGYVFYPGGGYAKEGGQGSGRKPYASQDPKRKDKAHIGWKNYGIDDYLEKAEKEYESTEADEDENKCEGCGRLEDYLNDENLCEDCQREAGIDRLESMRDAYEGRWDDEGDNGEHRSELEQARDTMEAEKELLDDTVNSKFPKKVGMDFQEGGERVIDEPREDMGTNELEDWQQRRYKEYEQDQKASDYLEKIKYSMDKGGAKFQRGEEQFEDPTPWASLAHLGATTVKDILFPAKEEHAFSDMTDKELEDLGKKESQPHQAEDLADEFWWNKKRRDLTPDELKKSKDTYKPKWKREDILKQREKEREAKEGGKGSGKKDHKGWMRAIEEDHTYDFCENCSMITEQVNNKCDMCGKKVGTEGRFSEIVWCDKCNKKVGEYEYSDVGDGYQNLAESLYYEVLREHEKKVH